MRPVESENLLERRNKFKITKSVFSALNTLKCFFSIEIKTEIAV